MSKKPGGGWSAASRAGTPPVARHPHHAKGAGPSARHLQREVHHLQHSGKHPHSTAKHKPGKASKKHQRRGLALGGMVACCAAEALAASLRLAGHPVSDADVLALYWATAQDADAGASIEETLWATTEHGLAGVRPLSFASSEVAKQEAGLILGVDLPGPHTVTVDADGQWLTWGEVLPPFPGAVVEEAWEIRWP